MKERAIYLDEELDKQLKNWAEQRGLQISSAVRMIIQDTING